MAKRILMVVTPQTTGDLRSAARSAAVVARESGGQVRMVFVRPIPPPRMDGHDCVVADPDAEMARLTALAEDRMAALAPSSATSRSSRWFASAASPASSASRPRTSAPT
jgi:hypothetical protein